MPKRKQKQETVSEDKLQTTKPKKVKRSTAIAASASAAAGCAADSEDDNVFERQRQRIRNALIMHGANTACVIGAIEAELYKRFHSDFASYRQYALRLHGVLLRSAAHVAALSPDHASEIVDAMFTFVLLGPLALRYGTTNTANDAAADVRAASFLHLFCASQDDLARLAKSDRVEDYVYLDEEDNAVKVSAQDMVVLQSLKELTLSALMQEMDGTTGVRIEGDIMCGQCKKYDVLDHQKQTKSCDEKTTTFCYCKNCKKSWVM